MTSVLSMFKTSFSPLVMVGLLSFSWLCFSSSQDFIKNKLQQSALTMAIGGHWFSRAPGLTLLCGSGFSFLGLCIYVLILSLSSSGLCQTPGTLLITFCLRLQLLHRILCFSSNHKPLQQWVLTNTRLTFDNLLSIATTPSLDYVF